MDTADQKLSMLSVCGARRVDIPATAHGCSQIQQALLRGRCGRHNCKWCAALHAMKTGAVILEHALFLRRAPVPRGITPTKGERRVHGRVLRQVIQHDVHLSCYARFRLPTIYSWLANVVFCRIGDAVKPGVRLAHGYMTDVKIGHLPCLFVKVDCRSLGAGGVSLYE